MHFIVWVRISYNHRSHIFLVTGYLQNIIPQLSVKGNKVATLPPPLASSDLVVFHQLFPSRCNAHSLSQKLLSQIPAILVQKDSQNDAVRMSKMKGACGVQ